MPAKRKMLAFSPEPAEMLAAKLTALGIETENKKMFGHEVHFLNGYMFAGANVDGVFVNLGEEGVNRALEQERDVAPFEPMEGMTMKEYLLLREPVMADEGRFSAWLRYTAARLAVLPPKVKKTKKKDR